MIEQQIRQQMVNTMKGWLGMSQKDLSHMPIINIYNTIDPLPRGYKMTSRDAWCAATISACAKENDCLDIIPAECSCNYMIRGFQKMGRWEERDNFFPNVADVIFYDWDDKGSGDDQGSSEHVGLVEYVSPEGKITVIEGNKGKAVARRYIWVNGRYIRGYGLPNYKKKISRTSMEVLVDAGIIQNPDYWENELRLNKIKFLPDLMGKMADYVREKE